MRILLHSCRKSVQLLLVCSLSALLAVSARAEKLSLKRAVELALTHSAAAGIAAADEQRAFAAYREARSQYIPQAQVGSGLGDSWGYPLSLEGAAPSLVNVTAQSPLFNPALRDYVRATRNEYEATSAGTKDRRKQIMQETALTYLELMKWEAQIEPLQRQQEDAQRMEQVVSQRVQEGVDSAQTTQRARLATARAHLRITQAQSAVEALRATLSQLTGISADSIQTDADSVTPLPDRVQPASAENSPAVMIARQHAIAQGFRARAEHRSLWPSVDFASQYAVLAKFNNWVQFFPRAFERNNATIGVVIRFPFFNAAQHAHAEAADADAIRANHEVELTKNQVSQETLKLQRSVEQLKAAQEVSELEYEISRSEADAIEVRMNSGTATVHDAANARAEMSAKYGALQDANFQLLRARVALLRSAGELESWVEQGK